VLFFASWYLPLSIFMLFIGIWASDVMARDGIGDWWGIGEGDRCSGVASGGGVEQYSWMNNGGG
jgi:hypothetical protein